MSSLLNTNTALGKDFDKLSGPDNFDAWLKDFEPIAIMHGCLGLYNGTEPVLERPSPPSFIPKPEAAPTQYVLRERRTADKLISSQQPLTPPGTSAARTEVPEDYQVRIAIYNSQMTDWKDNEKNARGAIALLRASVESWIWKEVPEDATGHPRKAWQAISNGNQASDNIRLERALEKLDMIKLEDATAIRPFLTKFEEVYNDIKEAGGTFTRAQLMLKINRGLSRPYNIWVENWKINNRDKVVTDEVFRDYRTSLLTYADDHKEQWQAFNEKNRDNNKTYNKGKYNKGQVRNNNGSRSNDGRSNSGPICDNCHFPGHTKTDCRFGSDAPRCTRCTRLGHAADNCKTPSRYIPRLNQNKDGNRSDGKRVQGGDKGNADLALSEEVAHLALDRIIASANDDIADIISMGRPVTSPSNTLSIHQDDVPILLDDLNSHKGDCIIGHINEHAINPTSELTDGHLSSMISEFCTFPNPIPMTYADKHSQECHGGRNTRVWGAGYRERELEESCRIDKFLNENLCLPATQNLAPASSSHFWVIDSGASRHVSNDPSIFSTMEPCNETLGSCTKDSRLTIVAIGTVEFIVTNTDGKSIVLILQGVCFAPQARHNLISVGTLSNAGSGFNFTINKHVIRIFSDGTAVEVAYAPKHATANVYILQVKRSPTLAPLAAAAVDFNDPVWSEHRRLGHLSLEGMRKLLKISDGINVTDAQIKAKIKDICPICYTTRALYKIPRDPAKRNFQNFGELVTVDTWGPYPVPGLKNERYALFLIDDATRYTWVVLFDTKDKIAVILIELLKRLSTEHQLPIIRIRCDNEFVQNSIRVYCSTEGITLEVTVPYAHHQAGLIERSHRSVRERSSAMIQDFLPSSLMTKSIVNRAEEMLRNATLPEGLWTYAIREGVNKKNRAPCRALKYKKTPFEALHGRKPDLSNDNAWGARVYVTIAPEQRLAQGDTKLHTPRGYIAHFLCAEGEKICWVWYSDLRMVKKISMARIDNTTGMNDPQPHGQHINDRAPQTQVNSHRDAGEESLSDEYAESDTESLHSLVEFSTMAIDDDELDRDYVPGPNKDKLDSNKTSDTNHDDLRPEEDSTNISGLQRTRQRIMNMNLNHSVRVARATRTRRQQKPLFSVLNQKVHTTAPEIITESGRIISPYFNKEASSQRGSEVQLFQDGKWQTSVQKNAIKTPNLGATALSPIDLTDLPTRDNSGVESSNRNHPEDSWNAFIPSIFTAKHDDITFSAQPELTLMNLTPDNKEIARYLGLDFRDDDRVNFNHEDEAQEHASDVSSVILDSQPPQYIHTCCIPCLTTGGKCNRMDNNTKCTNCSKHRRVCTPPTESEYNTATGACVKCYHSIRALTCNFYTTGGPCKHCTTNNDHLNCKGRKRHVKATVPIEKHCYTCKDKKLSVLPFSKEQLYPHQCNGEYPCNVCLDNGRICIHPDNAKNSKCNRCKDWNCNLAFPCQRCITKELVCSRWTDNNTTWTAWYPKEKLDKFDLPIGTRCLQCNSVHVNNRTCGPHLHPCQVCITQEGGRKTKK